jgi:hypothetical protein
MTHDPTPSEAISEAPGEALAFEPMVDQMVRRMADRLDGALDPRGESKIVVAEALMRLAMAVYISAQGPTQTRERLLTLAMALDVPGAVH